MIRFEHVSKSYDGKKNVVKDINLEIQRGEFLVFIGPSGCGKTTTLKMINRLIPLSEGTIWIDGKRISDYPIHELRWQIGYVLQQIALFPHMTIEENIAVVPELKGWKKEKIAQRVTELLEMVGLDANTYRNRTPAELSGGQQQRIGVVRALAADPEIILMDEPFSALDPISRTKLQDDLLHLKRTIQKTIVFVTHDVQEAFKLGDRICMMKDGQIEQIGTPQEILEHPASPFVQQFVSGVQQRVFSIQEWLEPLPAYISHSPALSLDAGWAEVTSILASHPQAVIQKDGQTIGIISREAVMKFLSEESAVGGWN